MSSNSNDEVVDEESSRETLKPWSDRWKKRRIGFHLKDVHPALAKHAASLLPDNEETETCSTTRIFVPLCGKAIDMAYLATSLSSSSNQKIEVVGLEGIRIALEEFIDEHPGLNISKEALASTEQVPFDRFVGTTVSLWKGDYFDLEKFESTTSIGTFQAIYDRASIVAIEPELRRDYVQILDSLLQTSGKILMVALERVASPDHPEAAKKGPPHSIPEARIRELFSGLETDAYCYQVEILQVTDQLEENPQDRERYRGLDKLLETVYWIRKETKQNAA